MITEAQKWSAFKPTKHLSSHQETVVHLSLLLFSFLCKANCVTRTSIDLERRDPLPQVTSVDLSIPHPLYLPRRCTTSSKPKLIHKVKYVSDPVENVKEKLDLDSFI